MLSQLLFEHPEPATGSILLTPVLSSDKYNMGESHTSSSKKTQDKNPWSKANPLSLLTFYWIWPIFRRGLSKDLDLNDLYPVPQIYGSEHLAEKFNLEWRKECDASQNKGIQPKLSRVLLSLCKRNLIVYFLILGFDELVIRVAQPICLQMLVKSFTATSDISRQDQVIFGVAVCACTFIHSYVMEHCVYLMLRTGLMCRVSCSSILYNKVTKLSPYARKDATTGKMMNLMSNDLGRFDQGLIFLGYTILAPIQTLIFIYFLWIEIGTGTVGGAALILLIIPLQVLNGRWTAEFRENIAKQTDERSRVMNEIVMAIRVIKMMAWESPFAQLVHNIRRMEVKALGKKMYLKAFYLSMYTVCNKMTPFLSILVYVLLGSRITADKAFFTVAVFQIIIENTVYYFSIAVASLGEIWISIRRIQEVLLMEEKLEENLENQISKKDAQSFIPGPSVTLSHAFARWSRDDAPVISNFNVDIKGDQLVMVIGSVGSGKSSFLHTLISELPLSSGKCRINGSITYAAQEPWLFAGTVQENILFGLEFDKQHYTDVVRVSALKDDLNQWPNGDMTMVGERGNSLSGGQKARINLARALYRDADIVLLDDPLSAVDSRVSRHIFDQCVKKYLRGRLRILATHQLQYISAADHVIVIKNGEILAQGTPVEIQALGLDLISLIEGGDDGDGSNRKASVTNVQEGAKVEVVATSEVMEDDASESANERAVSFATYWAYLRSGNSVFGLSAVILLFVTGQIIITMTDFWLSLWTNAEEKAASSNAPTKDLEKPLDILNPNEYYGDRLYLTVFGTLIGCVILSALTRAVTSFRYFLQISVNLHNRMFNSLVRAPAQFFDENPSGRIMNRFTKDIGSIDELLPPSLYDSVEYILQGFGVILVVIWSNFYLAIPSFVIVMIVLAIRFVYMKTSRDLKRVESQAKSPVLNHLAASIHGMITIRALKAEDNAINSFNKLLDAHSSPWFLFLSATRCFTVWIGSISAAFLTVITVTFLILSKNVAGGLIGFIITSTISLTTNLQWALREAADAENYMTCVARSIEYTKLPSEAAWESNSDKKPPADWPKEGRIKFNDVSLAYGDTKVLKNLVFEIKPREKIGVVGRTGAGKSSIISALFRITEPTGKIVIDGVTINNIGLHELRKTISIIPQDPVLFSGTIRYNLDPFNQFDDIDIWKVLEEVQLKQAFEALDATVEDGGANYSIGQRQLICLARAILRKNRIIVMDEATANVDLTTDAFIQQTIRDKFRDCTIITIAHRLQSVMDCDKILVMEKGVLKEYDHPHLLLQNKDGFLYQLVSYSGDSASAHLKEIAKKHYEQYYQ